MSANRQREEPSFPVFEEINEKRVIPPPNDDEDRERLFKISDYQKNTEPSTASPIWHIRVRGLKKASVFGSWSRELNHPSNESHHSFSRSRA